ncbi:MAG TPA: MauE/DoxX family redox-associated membrane protein [Fibrobacteria bacterium]|nr:MauE/DoxX family redox-associated membrane protein [Fibrobacteria bacterium]HOX49841.1 MauE/DoxX family redox-associated membrane protein [Fibrobacteria bacterium]
MIWFLHLRLLVGSLLVVWNFDKAMLLVPPGGAPLAGQGGVIAGFCLGVVLILEAARHTPPDRTRILFLARFFLGLLFVGASLDKIVNASPFSDTVLNYSILPSPTVNLFALWLPVLELVCGLLLLSGIWSREAGWLVAGMLLMFLVAVVQGVARGIDTHCGCFTQEGRGSAISAVTILRDVVFISVAGVAVWLDRDLPTWKFWKTRASTAAPG